MNWREHLNQYRLRHDISLKEAMQCEKCRKQYYEKKNKTKGVALVEPKTKTTTTKASKGRGQGETKVSPRMLELFKGTGSVGKVAKKMGYKIVSLDFDPIFTPDIETDILDWNYQKFYNETKFLPDFIWGSPPCNTFSQLEHFRGAERDLETAKPKTERAKEGTAILYRTLDIISFFQKLNPNLKFVIENPRGMMRNDLRIRRLLRQTTKYCLYGDNKSKPTDFFSNYPIDLKDASDTCPTPVRKVMEINRIQDKYSIPGRLIQSILEQSRP